MAGVYIKMYSSFFSQGYGCMSLVVDLVLQLFAWGIPFPVPWDINIPFLGIGNIHAHLDLIGYNRRTRCLFGTSSEHLIKMGLRHVYTPRKGRLPSFPASIY